MFSWPYIQGIKSVTHCNPAQTPEGPQSTRPYKILTLELCVFMHIYKRAPQEKQQWPLEPTNTSVVIGETSNHKRKVEKCGFTYVPTETLKMVLGDLLTLASQIRHLAWAGIAKPQLENMFHTNSVEAHCLSWAWGKDLVSENSCAFLDILVRGVLCSRRGFCELGKGDVSFRSYLSNQYSGVTVKEFLQAWFKSAITCSR